MKRTTVILIFTLALAAYANGENKLNGLFKPDLKHARAFQSEVMKDDALDEEIKTEIIDAYIQNVVSGKMELKIDYPKVTYTDGNVSFEGKITQYSKGYFVIKLNGILVSPGYYDPEEQTILFYTFKWNRSEPGEVVNASAAAGLSENHLHD